MAPPASNRMTIAMAISRFRFEWSGWNMVGAGMPSSSFSGSMVGSGVTLGAGTGVGGVGASGGVGSGVGFGAGSSGVTVGGVLSICLV